MEVVLYIVGGICIVAGSFVVLYTERARKWWAALTGPLPFKVLAFCPIVVGVLLMIAAPTSHTFWLVEALGALAVIKGLLLLLVPREEHRRWLLEWWGRRASDVTWRFAGLVGVILGVCLVLRL